MGRVARLPELEEETAVANIALDGGHDFACQAFEIDAVAELRGNDQLE